MGNSGRFPQGKPAAAESCYPTLIIYTVHAGSFRIHNPPNSDMDNRILTCILYIVIILMRTNVYNGGWSHQH